ncbi:MAG: enolase C-terminal domain-like protein [Chloroflexota bacterium]
MKALIDARAVDVIQPDVSICGGIAECLFLADRARLAGIQTAPHSWNSPIMHTATLHVAALLADSSCMPVVDTPVLEVDTTENPFIPTSWPSRCACAAAATRFRSGRVLASRWTRCARVPSLQPSEAARSG